MSCNHRIAIIRGALWLGAATASGYAVFASVTGRVVGTVVAAAIFSALILVDLGYYRRRTPFGPVQKWGDDYVQALAELNAAKRDFADGIGSDMRAGRYRVLEARNRLNEILDAKPRKTLWQRLTPWWVIALTPLLIIPVGLLTAPNAHSLMFRQTLVVSVVWTGDPECIQMWQPYAAAPTNVCSSTKQWSEIVALPNGVGLVGVDPEMSGAETMSCAITTFDGALLFTDFGVRGDGYEISCLVPWN